MRPSRWIPALVLIALVPAFAPQAQPNIPRLFAFPVDLSKRSDLTEGGAVDVCVRLRDATSTPTVLHEETFENCAVPAEGPLQVRLGFQKRVPRDRLSDQTVLCEITARPAGRGEYTPVGRPYEARLVFEKPKTLYEKIRLDRWVIIGLVGQLLFTMRFVLQWIATERRRESTIPIAFWWCSLGGGLTVLVYGLIEREPIIILGQSCAFLVYLRNLYFIYRKKRHEGVAEAHPEEIT